MPTTLPTLLVFFSVQRVAAFAYIIQQWVGGLLTAQFNDRKIVRYSILILVLWEIWERCELAEREKRMNLTEKTANCRKAG
jgi:hypothetical protein